MDIYEGRVPLGIRNRALAKLSCEAWAKEHLQKEDQRRREQESRVRSRR